VYSFIRNLFYQNTENKSFEIGFIINNEKVFKETVRESNPY